MFLYFKTAAKVVIISKPPNKYGKNKLFQVFGVIVDACFAQGLTALGARAAGAAVLFAALVAGVGLTVVQAQGCAMTGDFGLA